MKDGISICVVTFNTLEFTKMQVGQIRKMTRLVPYEMQFYDNGSTDGTVEWLSEQKNVTLHLGANNSKRHGEALDFLVKKASMEITCTLCSDAFPISPEWIVPALHLEDEVVMAGILRTSQRKIKNCICPSYLFGWTQWLSIHTFADAWPEYDTGELLVEACLKEKLYFKTWPMMVVEFDFGAKPKRCNYNGWVWHNWWSTRMKVMGNRLAHECETDYHAKLVDFLKKHVIKE